MGPSIRSIQDVADKHLCSGCGVCAYLQPGLISMEDEPDRGLRPLVRPLPDGSPGDTSPALAACPGIGLSRLGADPDSQHLSELWEGWGPVIELWEGYAADPEVRHAASSGGIATALALHCIDEESMHGVLHIRARQDVPYLNKTVLSRTRVEMLEATGSRYAPASPCDRLDLVEEAPEPCVFIGKPCDVAALSMARRLRPELDRQVGLTIAIFCAGTPSTRGTLEMLSSMGIDDVKDVESIRYRGNGWPGPAEAVVQTPQGQVSRTLTYEESWGEILQKHRQWRCYVCADHTGEFADVAVGDPWYRPIPPDEPGRSLVVVRTERGRQLVNAAISSGSLRLERVSPDILPASQPNLLRAEGATWGRTVATRMVGVASPRYRNFRLLPIWWRHLSGLEKTRSILGTFRRVITKRLYRRASPDNQAHDRKVSV